MKNPSILFIGSKDIGYHCLNELIKGKETIVGVICRRDDPYENQWYKSVTQLALKNNLKVFKPADINNINFVSKISNLNPDILICVQYPKIFNPNLIKVPPMGFIDEGVDSGDLISQNMFEIKDNDSGFDLYKRCTQKALNLFRKTLPVINSGKIPRHKQDNSQAIKYPREVPYNRTINWNWEARKVYNFIRALYFPPFECTFTVFNQNKICIPKSEIVENNNYKKKKAGEIVEITKNGFLIKVFDKCLFIPKIQSKEKMINASQYLLSHNIKVGSVLGR